VTKQWTQNDLISRMLFSELYKIMVNKVTFVGFRGGRSPPSGFALGARYSNDVLAAYNVLNFKR